MIYLSFSHKDEDQKLPKPGGKVWIKKRLCQIANSKFKVKGHQHIRYHMVGELPEFDKVYNKIVLFENQFLWYSFTQASNI